MEELGLPRRKHTFEDKARVCDGLLLRLPDMSEVEESGSIEAVHHRDHLLLPITLPAGREVVDKGWHLGALPHYPPGEPLPRQLSHLSSGLGMGWQMGPVHMDVA